MAKLLVDGDENFRRALAVALRLEGVPVAEASTTDVALALLAGTSFDTVVVDLLLPGARALVERLADRVQVVACSPHRESFGALPAGAIALEKPFSAEELLAALKPSPRAVGEP